MNINRALTLGNSTYTINTSRRQVAVSGTHTDVVTVYARRDAARLIRSLRNNGYTSQRLDSMGYPVSRP